MAAVAEAKPTIRSTIPARLDRLSWSPFHTRMVCGLGAAWILDGLQITISSSVTGVLIKPQTLGMTSTQVGLIASIYLIGDGSSRTGLFIGYLVCGGIMILGVVELLIGIKAEGKSLEEITTPLTSTTPANEAVEPVPSPA